MKVSGIYQIKCVPNGRVYIGKARDIATRWREHLSYLEEGKHSCKPLQADFDKYGIESFGLSVKETLDATQFKEREIDNELDKLEAKWGEEQEALDSSTGYNYLSRFRYEKRVKNSMLMLNKHRVAIGEELGARCLAVYASMLAHYDYGKHMVIILTGNVARETGMSEKTVKQYFDILTEEGYIKETEMQDNGSPIPRFFLIRKSERDNLESQRYEYYDPANTDSTEDYVKQRIRAIKAENDRIRADYHKMANYYKQRIERLEKDLDAEWDKTSEMFKKERKLEAENQELKKKIQQLENNS